MITNQIIQVTIEGLKNILRYDITVIDRNSRIVATTEAEEPVYMKEFVSGIVSSYAENLQIQGNLYFRVLDNQVTEYIIVISGEDEDAFKVGKLAAFHLQALILAYKERFDRDNFIKNLLLDNLLMVDIISIAKKLRIENNLKRMVYLVEIPSDIEFSAVEILRGIFPDLQRDFVTAIDETSIVLVKELKEADTTKEIEKIANNIVDTLSSEAMCIVSVAIGTVVNELFRVSSSYKEARLAQEVGKIFEPDKQIVNFENLGIGRLIYQLPVPLCKIFINEMLQGFSIDDIDDEMFATVVKFFENDLNVSETARDLFIHRNTLVYRLDKLQKLTRLDLRKFTDAITFKITLMVSRYMQFRERHSL